MRVRRKVVELQQLLKLFQNKKCDYDTLLMRSAVNLWNYPLFAMFGSKCLLRKAGSQKSQSASSPVNRCLLMSHLHQT